MAASSLAGFAKLCCGSMAASTVDLRQGVLRLISSIGTGLRRIISQSLKRSSQGITRLYSCRSATMRSTLLFTAQRTTAS